MFKKIASTAAASLTALQAAGSLSAAPATPAAGPRKSGRQTLAVGAVHAYAVALRTDGEALVRARSDGWIGLFVYDGAGYLVDWSLEDDGAPECELRPLMAERCTLRVVNLDGHSVAYTLETTAAQLERLPEPPRDPAALLARLR